MKADFAATLCCPARDCNGADLAVRARQIQTITYNTGSVEEVREGDLVCASCGRTYPIREYVPSFEQLFPADLQEEADYWSKWYGFMWEHGYLGFFDLRLPRAPLITEGITVLDPSSLDRTEGQGSHTFLADHPLIKGAERVLDMGCGTGWSSLYLARRGHRVAGFDPSASSMRLAKRYAISQGEYIEYLAGALGYIAFKPQTFDAVFALHSIHHVPRLHEEIAIVRKWLRDGGAIALDEHIRNNPLLNAIAAQMHAWAQAEVYPKVRSLGEDDLRQLPQTLHSNLEDVGSEEVVEAVLDHFVLESFESRCVSLDFFSFIYYLSRDLDAMLFHDGMKAGARSGSFDAPNLDVRGYHYAADLLNRLYQLLLRAFPEGAEYVTLIARKVDHAGSATSEQATLAQRASSLAETPLPATIIDARESLSSTRARLEAAIAASNEAVGELRSDLDRLNQAIHAKNDYIADLELILSVKNDHIRRLERLARRQQKALDILPVKIMLRLLRLLTGRRK